METCPGEFRHESDLSCLNLGDFHGFSPSDKPAKTTPYLKKSAHAGLSGGK